MANNKKSHKGLSDQELVTKYESGSIDLSKTLEKTFKPSQEKCEPKRMVDAKKK